MCDAWDHPTATHTREDVIHAAMIRAGMCAARGLSESQACHPPGCAPSLLAAGVTASVSPAPRNTREPGGLLPVHLWGLSRREEKTLDALCAHGRSKVVADVLCISQRAVEHQLSMINKKAGGTYLSSLLIALAWDRAKRGVA